MLNMLLLVVVLALSSCATTPPESVPHEKSNLPEAVTSPPSASAEGALLKRSQDGFNAMLNGLRNYLGESAKDLLMSLERARVSPPPTAPAAPTR